MLGPHADAQPGGPVGATVVPFSILDIFNGPTNAGDGAAPMYGHLTPMGGYLYGMTGYGSANNCGTIFGFSTVQRNPYQVLHSFNSADPANGSRPYGSLTLVGTTLYGMTGYGGANNKGTIFKYETKPMGGGFKLLHSFGSGEGAVPFGSLTLVGTTLYGMTNIGGDNELGTIFKYDPKSDKLTVLHSFAGGATDGQYPRGSLILAGKTLYGMTLEGGATGEGTIFKYDTKAKGDGFGFLHSFNSADPANGSSPYGSLTLVGTALYGMTFSGGANGYGTIFKYYTNSMLSPFALVHSFDLTDGANPSGDLTFSGTTLYGMTYAGGDHNNGTIFKHETNARISPFSVLHSFDSTDAANGSGPYGSLTLLKTPPAGSKTTLYGMTNAGGNRTNPQFVNGMGTLFSYTRVFTISGAVKTSTGASKQNVTLTLKDTFGTTTAPTDQSGVYLFTDLLDSIYTLTPSLPGWAFSPPGVTAHLKDANLIQDFTCTPVTISGIVSFNGKPVETGLTMTLSGTATGSAVPDINSGVYSFPQLLSGRYTVTPTFTTPHPDPAPKAAPQSSIIVINGKSVMRNFHYKASPSCFVRGCHTK